MSREHRAQHAGASMSALHLEVRPHVPAGERGQLLVGQVERYVTAHPPASIGTNGLVHSGHVGPLDQSREPPDRATRGLTTLTAVLSVIPAPLYAGGVTNRRRHASPAIQGESEPERSSADLHPQMPRLNRGPSAVGSATASGLEAGLGWHSEASSAALPEGPREPERNLWIRNLCAPTGGAVQRHPR